VLLPPPDPSEMWARWTAATSAETPTLLDPNLTLTRTQHPAIVGNTGNRKPYSYAEFATTCTSLQPLSDHS
jgi:hypothetical protein